MPPDKTPGENLPVPFIEQGKDMMMPLTKALTTAMEEAFQRFQKLTEKLDSEALPEKERSGVILARCKIEKYKQVPQVFTSDDLLSQREYTQWAASEISDFVKTLPAWVPELFEGYEKKFSMLSEETLDLSLGFMASPDVDEYFNQGIHSFILNCLILAQDEAWTVEKTIGGKSIRILDLEKILGKEAETYHSGHLNQNQSFEMLKKAVIRAKLRQRMLASKSDPSPKLPNPT